jgi:hypothetical protein
VKIGSNWIESTLKNWRPSGRRHTLAVIHPLAVTVFDSGRFSEHLTPEIGEAT